MKNITVYSKPNCVACTFTKKYMEENNIPYEAVDVMEDAEALELIKEHGHQGVPVVSIDNFDDSWNGFRPDRLSKLNEVSA